MGREGREGENPRFLTGRRGLLARRNAGTAPSGTAPRIHDPAADSLSTHRAPGYHHVVSIPLIAYVMGGILCRGRRRGSWRSPKRPYRILYAFDHRRIGVLLVGGEKTRDDRWYERNVPLADRLYDAHLATLTREP